MAARLNRRRALGAKKPADRQSYTYIGGVGLILTQLISKNKREQDQYNFADVRSSFNHGFISYMAGKLPVSSFASPSGTIRVYISDSGDSGLQQGGNLGNGGDGDRILDAISHTQTAKGREGDEQARKMEGRIGGGGSRLICADAA